MTGKMKTSRTCLKKRRLQSSKEAEANAQQRAAVAPTVTYNELQNGMEMTAFEEKAEKLQLAPWYELNFLPPL